MAAAELLFEQGHIPQSTEEKTIRQTGVNGASQQFEAALVFTGGEEPARDAGEIFAATNAEAGQSVAIRLAESGGDDGGEAGEREDVDGVVVEHRHQPLRLARTQIFKVDVRDHFARQVAFTLKAEDLLFEFDEAAAFEAQFPETARAVEEIEVRETAEGRFAAAHAIAHVEQRLIVAAAVVSDQDVEAAEVVFEGGEKAEFLGILAHEELAQAKTFGRNAADADQKCVSTGAFYQAGGFGVEKGPALAVGSGNGTFAESIHQIWRKRGEAADVGGAVLLVSGEEALGLEVGAVRVFDDVAVGEFFDAGGR